jgi:hypothetical protein
MAVPQPIVNTGHPQRAGYLVTEVNMVGRGREGERQPHTFVLDQELVERARREVGEPDMVRSIEAALAAAIDYNSWVREVRAGRRDVFS